MQRKDSRYETVAVDGHKVRKLRRGLRLTQEALAALVPRVSRGYVSIIEAQPSAKVSRPTAEQLATALGISFNELVVRERPPAAVRSPPGDIRVRGGLRTEGDLLVTSGRDPESRADMLRGILLETEAMRDQLEGITEIIAALLQAEEETE